MFLALVGSNLIKQIFRFAADQEALSFYWSVNLIYSFIHLIKAQWVSDYTPNPEMTWGYLSKPNSLKLDFTKFTLKHNSLEKYYKNTR